MALLGQGVLAIWNGIAPAAEAEFVSWHVREHIPERVGVPGFLRGRRYVAVHGEPKYFNFYEADTADVFTSPAYQARLNDPTPWTQQVVAHFTDTSRTICDVASTQGIGEGACIEAIQLQAHQPDALLTAMTERLLPAVLAHGGIVGAHLLRGRAPIAAAPTAEMILRGVPDQTADWIVLIEAVDIEALTALRQAALSDSQILIAGARAPLKRGVYRLQFALTKTELNLKP